MRSYRECKCSSYVPQLLIFHREKIFSLIYCCCVSHRRSWQGLTTPLFLTFCLHIYFQQNFFISLLFHLFFLILTCSCQYSYNLMLTLNCMCRPSCNNVAPVTNLCLGRATTRSHSSQWSKKKVAVET